jgi:hypothetical protein
MTFRLIMSTEFVSFIGIVAKYVKLKEKLASDKQQAYQKMLITKKVKANQMKEKQQVRRQLRRKEKKTQQCSKSNELVCNVVVNGSTEKLNEPVVASVNSRKRKRETEGPMESEDRENKFSKDRSSQSKLPSRESAKKKERTNVERMESGIKKKKSIDRTESTLSSRKKAKSKSNQDQKRREREHARERKRKQHAKQRQDPEFVEKEKEINHAIYLQRKEKGKIKLIAQKSNRERKLQQKRWRLNTIQYKERQAAKRKANEFIHANTPSSQNSEFEQSQTSSTMISAKSRGRKRVHLNRSATSRKLQKVEMDLMKAQQKVEKYKKRISRLKEKKSSPTPTPKTKVRKLVGKNKVPRRVAKRLLFGEVLHSALIEKKKECGTSRIQNKNFAQDVAGKILKKYKMVGQAKSFIS